MNSRQKQAILKQLKAERDKMASCRDSLRELMEVVEEDFCHCQDAEENLQCAIERISEIC